jgi:hypothetical protein
MKIFLDLNSLNIKQYFYVTTTTSMVQWSEFLATDPRALQEEKKVVGLEGGPLSLVSTTEEPLGRNSSSSGLENREYGRRDLSRWPHGTLYPQKVGTNFTDKRRLLGRYSSLEDFFLPYIWFTSDTFQMYTMHVHF